MLPEGDGDGFGAVDGDVPCEAAVGLHLSLRCMWSGGDGEKGVRKGERGGSARDKPPLSHHQTLWSPLDIYTPVGV